METDETETIDRDDENKYFYAENVAPSFEETRAAFVENFGVHSRTWRPLGFGSPNQYKHYLTAKGWWHKLSLKENPDIKAEVSERYARIAIPALVKQALNGSFQATRMILVDQCKDWGWGAADIATAAAGAGKTIAELFGEEEEKEKAKAEGADK